MNTNDELRIKIGAEIEIDRLVREIETNFGYMINMFHTYTCKAFGKEVSIYTDRHPEVRDVFEFKHIEMIVKEHGYSTACFLVYSKGKWWNKKQKEFYCSSNYSFYAERSCSNRYDFTVEDYELILEDIKNMITKFEELNKGEQYC